MQNYRAPKLCRTLFRSCVLFSSSIIVAISVVSVSPSAVNAENAAGYDCTHTVSLASVEDARTYLPKHAKPNPDQWFFVDARPESAYGDGRIPGSVSMPWEDWTHEKPGFLNSLFGHPERWGKVLDRPKSLQSSLQSLGLVDGEPILVVGDAAYPGAEGRMVWNLLYWGASCIKILDGGFTAWKLAKLPIETVSTPRIRGLGDFTVRLQSRRRALAGDVLGARVILDARTVGEFRGNTQRGQKEAGHIRGSRLFDARTLYRTNGTFISERELRNLLAETFDGFDVKKDRAVAYSLNGVPSALLAVFIEMNLNIPVANYDGSLLEWSRLGKPLVNLAP